ncbi:MAG: L-aspartate oxidase [Oligoflexia bacterium]|nr:L-aspartate oxidase [Oligoflexia bacterium]
MNTNTYSDALVLGSGLAGLNFALRFAEKNPQAIVTVITKSSDPRLSATDWAQGGIAAAMGKDDSIEEHFRDTIRTGGGLSKPEIVKMVIESGKTEISHLLEYGVQFTKSESSPTEFDFTKEGGHSKRRVLHAADHTGKSIMEALLERIAQTKNIKLQTNWIAIDLISDAKIQKRRSTKNSKCLGAYVLDLDSKKVMAIRSIFTLIATGGAGKVYKYTSNPDTSVGDGIAMAYRLGAKICNMEFIQFHPTCLYHPEARTALLSEALRGEGAHLLNARGERFMEKYHPDLELAPRDIVALSIDKEMKKHGDECVYLDISHKGEEFVQSHFPHNSATCKRYGFDLAKEPVPVVPAAHYTCGGIRTNIDGQTEIINLYAAGEASHTGLHGANRLASNSLLEAAVFSTRAAEHASSIFKSEKSNIVLQNIPDWNPGFAKEEQEEVIISHCWDEVRTLMWNYVGIVRSNRRLEYAARRVSLLKQEINQAYWERKLSKNLIELRNLITVAELIVSSAQNRKESRGLHQNLDYPEVDDELYQRDTIL